MTTYVCWIIVLSIIANALRGIHQAQAMCKPTDRQHKVWWIITAMGNYEYANLWDKVMQFDLGARGHVWYRWYHAIDAGSFAAFAGLVWLLVHAHSWEPFGLAIAFMWLAYEPTYQYGRYRTVFDTAYKEHVCFFDLIDFHASKWTMTAIRVTLVAAMITLTIGG